MELFPYRTISAIIIFITFILHGNLFVYGIRDCFSLCSLGLGLALIAGAIFFPLAISVALSIFTSVIIMNAVNMLVY